MDMNNDSRTYDMENGQEEVIEKTPSGPENRKRKKPRVKKKRRKKYYTLRILLVILLCITVYFFLHSAVFTVENINLEKNDRFSSETVREITGLKKGVNIFEIDLKDCEAALQKEAYIKSADISRDLPDTINISIETRVPVAVVKHDGKYVMIDREGYVVERRRTVPHYTFFNGVTVSDAEIGQAVKIKNEKLYQQYMSLIDEMNAADLYFRKMAIDGDNVKLYVKPELYCSGEKKNIIEGMRDGNLKAVLYTLSKKGVEKGVINVGDDKYYSYRKSVKK